MKVFVQLLVNITISFKFDMFLCYIDAKRRGKKKDSFDSQETIDFSPKH